MGTGPAPDTPDRYRSPTLTDGPTKIKAMKYGQRPKHGAVAKARDGHRLQVKARFTPEMYDAMHRKAALLGISASAYLGRLVAEDNQLPDPLSEPDDDQGVLPLVVSA